MNLTNKFKTLVLSITLFLAYYDSNAQIIFHAGGTGSTGTNTTNPTVNRPSGVLQNHLIIVIIHFDNRPTSAPSNSSFTLITSAAGGSANDPAAVYAFYRIAGSSEPSTYTFTTTGSQNHRIQAIRVTGHNTSSPIGSTSSIRPGTAATSVTIPGVTTTNQSSVLVSAFTAPVDVVSSGELKDFNVPHYMGRLYRGNGSTSVPSYAAAREIINVPGATGTRAYSWSSSERAAAIMFVVNPSTSSIDADGDGVQNYLDLDNDNDGITDANEGYSTTASSVSFSSLVSASFANGTYGTGNSQYTWSKASNFNGSSYLTNFIAPPQVSTDGFRLGDFGSGGGSTDFSINFSANVTNLQFSFSDWDGGNLFDGYEYVIVEVYDIGNNLLNAFDYVDWMGSNVQASSTVNRFNGVEYNVDLSETDRIGTLSFDFRSNVIDRIEITYGTLDASLRFQEPIYTVVTTRNTDGDASPDHLDLDSDNDGCHDALEGSATITSSQLLNGAINIANQGGVSASGIPNAVNTGSGQTIGTSRLATRLVVNTPPSSFMVNSVGQSASFSVVTTASNNTSWSGTVNSRIPVYGTSGNANSQTVYRWFDGDPDNGGVVLTNTGVYSGVTTSTLNISNSTGLINNVYYVRITQSNNPCIRQIYSSTLSLPVTFVNLKASCNANNVIVEWETVHEKNNSHFEILKLQNNEWVIIGTQKGAGNSNETLMYSFVDQNSNNNDINYYQIKQVDYDLNYTSSKIIYSNCNFNLNNDIKAYPNPFTNKLIIELNIDNFKGECEIYNAEGKLVFKNLINEYTEISTTDFLPGVYFVKIQNEVFYKTIKLVRS